MSFKHENGFLVYKKFCRTRIWIPYEKLLLLAAWDLSRLENWASSLVSKKHVEVPRNYYTDIIFGKTAEGDDFFDYARPIKKKSVRGYFINSFISHRKYTVKMFEYVHRYHRMSLAKIMV